MKGNGHGLVCVGAEAYGKVVYRTFLTVEYKGIWFLLAFETVCYGFKSVGAVNPVQHPLYC